MSVTIAGFEHAVAWREFSRVAERPRRATEDAFVRAATHIAYDFAGEGRNWSVTEVRATISVDQAASWVVQTSQTDELLAHEQGHYDITAIGLREEANLTAAITGSGEADIKRQRRRVRRAAQSRINEANERYDSRTNHGSNVEVQRRWERSIAAAKGNDEATLADLPD